MTLLRWNNIDVQASSLTQRAYRAAPCEVLVDVNPRNQTEALQAFADNSASFSGLHVAGISDLGFLSDFPNLRYLEVVDQKSVDTLALAGLNNLRGLHLETPGSGLDFACFPELEVFVGDWHEDNCNVHRCPELRRLRIWQFKPKSQDLATLAHATRLECLELTQTGIRSLAGLETLEDLRYCEIAHAAKLESLDALTKAPLELRELAFSKAKKIASYESIAALRRLRRLWISGCAPMANLQWTQGLKDLDFFSFVDTNVEDGDLSPLLRLPKLCYVGTMDKKHYNFKFQAINQLLSQRAAGHSPTAGN